MSLPLLVSCHNGTEVHWGWYHHGGLIGEYFGNIFTILHAHILGNLLLRRAHEIGGVGHAIFEDVVL